MSERTSTILDVRTVPWEQGPALFIDYVQGRGQTDHGIGPAPTSAKSFGSIADQIAASEYPRGELCSTLAAYNTRIGNSPEALENIDRLRRPDCMAVLTGQQAG